MLCLSVSVGHVHKLSQHNMEFGVTDAVCCAASSLLMASGYDLDNGVGYVNGTLTTHYAIYGYFRLSAMSMVPSLLTMLYMGIFC